MGDLLSGLPQGPGRLLQVLGLFERMPGERPGFFQRPWATTDGFCG